jgi:hypothetical protein
MKLILDHVEIALGGGGLMIFSGLTALVYPPDSVLGLVTFIFTPGLVLAAVLEARRRKLRQQTITEIRDMLRDVVNSQLAIIEVNAYLAQRDSATDSERQRHHAKITDSAQQIAATLEVLSEDALECWRGRYEEKAGHDPCSTISPAAR